MIKGYKDLGCLIILLIPVVFMLGPIWNLFGYESDLLNSISENIALVVSFVLLAVISIAISIYLQHEFGEKEKENSKGQNQKKDSKPYIITTIIIAVVIGYSILSIAESCNDRKRQEALDELDIIRRR